MVKEKENINPYFHLQWSHETIFAKKKKKKSEIKESFRSNRVFSCKTIVKPSSIVIFAFYASIVDLRFLGLEYYQF